MFFLSKQRRGVRDVCSRDIWIVSLLLEEIRMEDHPGAGSALKGFKVCTKCKESKSVFCFSQNKKARDGLESWCKDCSNNRSRKRKRIPRR